MRFRLHATSLIARLPSGFECLTSDKPESDPIRSRESDKNITLHQFGLIVVYVLRGEIRSYNRDSSCCSVWAVQKLRELYRGSDRIVTSVRVVSQGNFEAS